MLFFIQHFLADIFGQRLGKDRNPAERYRWKNQFNHSILWWIRKHFQLPLATIFIIIFIYFFFFYYRCLLNCLSPLLFCIKCLNKTFYDKNFSIFLTDAIFWKIICCIYHFSLYFLVIILCKLSKHCEIKYFSIQTVLLFPKKVTFQVYILLLVILW